METKKESQKNVKKTGSRRDFLKKAGAGAAGLAMTQWIAKPAAAEQNPPPSPPAELYNEKYRPQFHFTPRKNWTNDPNGLVYYKGEYHMFFQHNPFGIKWGNMTWAHAVSTDLVRWKQLDDAIKPDELGTIFSGSAVVDWENTSGLQTGSENVLIAFYTAAGKFAKPEKKKFTQCLAYSNDRGRTWSKYQSNPVIEHIRGENRDPKVIRHKPTQTWIMALYLTKDDFMLLSSKNLKEWKQLQELKLPGSDECPDFFELPVDGDPRNTRWVFWGADGRYLLGSFDGTKFTPESGPFESRVGNYYASQTWSDIPKSDGRRIQIAWMAGGKFPNMPFNQQMSIPCELTLRTFAEGIRLCRVPVREIKNIRNGLHSWRDINLKPGDNPLSEIQGELFEIESEIALAGASEVGFNLRGTPLVYNVQDKELHCRGEKAKLPPINGRIKLHIFVDRTSIEIFANDGRVCMFRCFPLDADNTSLEVFTRGGDTKIRSLNVWPLKSIWRKT